MFTFVKTIQMNFDQKFNQAEKSNTWTNIIGWAALIVFFYWITHP